MNRLYLFLPLFAILFIQCKKYESAPDAFFIRSKASVNITSTSQGSACHNITDLFVYVNGKFQGAYPTGNLLPIVTKGEQVSMDVYAGIKNNGIKSTTVTWLLYDKVHLDTLVEAGKTIDYDFKFRYASGVTFTWTENFDQIAGYSLVKNPSSDTSFKVFNDAGSFEGKYALMGVDGSRSTCICESSVPYGLPKGNSNVYVQFTYKCDAEFVVGINDGAGISKDIVVVTPKSDWNTIYIQLSDAVSRDPQADKYKVFFRLVLPNGSSQAHVWLDNIKLMYL